MPRLAYMATGCRLSGPGSSVGVASADTAFAQTVQDRGRVDGEMPGYLGQGPASVVVVDCLADLFGVAASVGDRLSVLAVNWRRASGEATSCLPHSVSNRGQAVESRSMNRPADIT